MYNVFWRLALFVRGQSFSVRTFDRSRNGCQVIREGAGNDFRGPSVQALPLPSRVSFSRVRFSLCPLLPSACYAGYEISEEMFYPNLYGDAMLVLIWMSTNISGGRKPTETSVTEFCN